MTAWYISVANNVYVIELLTDKQIYLYITLKRYDDEIIFSFVSVYMCLSNVQDLGFRLVGQNNSEDDGWTVKIW